MTINGHATLLAALDSGLRPMPFGHLRDGNLKSPLEPALMRRVEQALDPLNLMNPGKVLS